MEDPEEEARGGTHNERCCNARIERSDQAAAAQAQEGGRALPSTEFSLARSLSCPQGGISPSLAGEGDETACGIAEPYGHTRMRQLPAGSGRTGHREAGSEEDVRFCGQIDQGIGGRAGETGCDQVGAGRRQRSWKPHGPPGKDELVPPTVADEVRHEVLGEPADLSSEGARATTGREEHARAEGPEPGHRANEYSGHLPQGNLPRYNMHRPGMPGCLP